MNGRDFIGWQRKVYDLGYWIVEVGFQTLTFLVLGVIWLAALLFLNRIGRVDLASYLLIFSSLWITFLGLGICYKLLDDKLGIWRDD